MNRAIKPALAALPLLLLLLFVLQSCAWVQKPLLRRRAQQEAGQLAIISARLLSGEDAALPDWVSGTEVYPGLIFYDAGRSVVGRSARARGVFYAADGRPHPWPGADFPTELPVMFGFRWKSPDGSSFYAEHITGNLYYYELRLTKTQTTPAP